MLSSDGLALKNKKLFLATFEFISGEYEQSFHRFLYARDKKDLERQIKGYLKITMALEIHAR